MPLFEKNKIIAKLQVSTQLQLAEIEVFPSIDSTNQYLLERNHLPSGWVCIAETQTQGRGRLGRQWISPATGNLYFSLLWHFKKNTRLPWGSLSLIVGLSIVRVLQQLIREPIQIKWPNDILIRDKKIAGILIESNQNNESLNVVIGLGLNICLPIEYRNNLPYPVTDLESERSSAFEYNDLVANIMNELFNNLTEFTHHGFKYFQSEWLKYAKYLNQPVTLTNGASCIEGIMVGINEEGALLVDQNGIIQAVYSGEFSLRPQL